MLIRVCIFAFMAISLSASQAIPDFTVIPSSKMPFIRQQGENLCWAAVTRMVMKVVDVARLDDVRQCGLVDSLQGKPPECCDGTPDTQHLSQTCDITGTPIQDGKFRKSPDGAQKWTRSSSPGKLPWDHAVQTLLGDPKVAPQPFVFSLAFLDASGHRANQPQHAMIAYGYKYVKNASNVKVDSGFFVWNPLGAGWDANGVGLGDSTFMTYAAYDYGKIKRAGGTDSVYYGDGASFFDVR
jgi:hypothetical protein